jgi:hypothetical protein
MSRETSSCLKNSEAMKSFRLKMIRITTVSSFRSAKLNKLGGTNGCFGAKLPEIVAASELCSLPL